MAGDDKEGGNDLQVVAAAESLEEMKQDGSYLLTYHSCLLRVNRSSSEQVI